LESAGCNELPALSWGLRCKSEPRPGGDFSPARVIVGKQLRQRYRRVDRPLGQLNQLQASAFASNLSAPISQRRELFTRQFLKNA
jgi:hypothetical protein